MGLSCAGIDMVLLPAVNTGFSIREFLSHSTSVQCPSALTSLAAYMPPLVVQS
jgi:hypothetical protein